MTVVGPAADQRPKAYSYIRFSTPEQAAGDSFQRQTEQAQAYAQRRGLDLDQNLTYEDLGVSGFDGSNAQRGALSAFRFAVHKGEVLPGSYLLVESFDRISRMDPWEALPIFQEIINAGVTIVTLQDGKEWNREGIRANPFRIIESLLVMMRAYDESATKSLRVSEAYERKRRYAASGAQSKPFTLMLPAWLRWDKAKGMHLLIPDRAELLRDIFQKADQGWSKHRISRWLNEQHIDTWGTGKRKAPYWRSSYIAKLLTNSAVVGTFTPHKALKDSTGRRVRKPLDPIENYWPASIDRDLFERVSSQAKARAARGRNSDAEPRSIFAGIIRCAHCGGTVTRVSKGQHVYLVCSRANARAKGCRYLAVPYANVEEAMQVNARAIVGNAPRGRDTAELENEIEYLDVLVSELSDEAQDLLDIVMREKSEAARKRLRDKEAELDAAKEELQDLRTRRDTLTTANVRRKLDAVRTALERKPVNVAEANSALRQAVSRIVMDPEQSTLTIYWHHAEQPSEDIHFWSRNMFNEAQ
jgi:DNA invertase Pin-like site-specific DNA recombinase